MELFKVGVIGSGAMGSGIAQVAALAGHEVHVYDANPVAAQSASNNMQISLKKLVEKGKCTEEKYNLVSQNVIFQSSIEKLNTCDLIIEAIVENIGVKQEVFSALESIVSDKCILASNTSSLSITSIASICKNPERFIGIHFFNPANIMPLVEIIPALQTDSSVTETAIALIQSWGKTVVVCKDTPGFIVNRVARSYYGEAIRMYEEGIADVATIDWAMKKFGGFKMGPFELMDFIGHDVNYKVTETVWEQLFYDPRFKPSLTQKRLYEAKRFGKKSGIGFYDYREGAIKVEPTEDDELGNYIFNRITAMLINEAIDTLYLDIASKEDIDLAMTKGVNYPKGLLAWADEIGLGSVLEELESLMATYEEDRYRPSVLLKHMVREKKHFY
ncbi:MAG: 3-hydroxybutyryl-CoA dehydrogenase [Sphingobacteriales bacterium]|nr:3-hydroxybutyryl-CoA dehydrogenase [Sphingobacteriales bacterium]